MDKKKITAKVLKKLGGSSGELLREFEKQEDEKTAGACGNKDCKCDPCECGDKCKCGYSKQAYGKKYREENEKLRKKIKGQIEEKIADLIEMTDIGKDELKELLDDAYKGMIKVFNYK